MNLKITIKVKDKIEAIMNGEIDELIDALITDDQSKRLSHTEN